MGTTITMSEARDQYRAGNDAGRGFAPDGETVDEAVASYVEAGGALVLARHDSDEVAVVSSPWSDHTLIAIGGDAGGRNAWAVELPAPVKLPRARMGVGGWHVPPECQGQIVEVSYACDEDGYPICRTQDRGDRSIKYQRASEVARDDYEPWNKEPGGYVWEPVELEGDA